MHDPSVANLDDTIALLDLDNATLRVNAPNAPLEKRNCPAGTGVVVMAEPSVASPFHRGERETQTRLGVANEMKRRGAIWACQRGNCVSDDSGAKLNRLADSYVAHCSVERPQTVVRFLKGAE